AAIFSAKEDSNDLLLALSRHHDRADPCPLLEVKRTLRGHPQMSAFDPFPTLSDHVGLARPRCRSLLCSVGTSRRGTRCTVSFRSASSFHREILSMSESMPPMRVRAIFGQLERELRKSPDFRLYLLSKSLKDRARTERMMMQPSYRHRLMNSFAIGE